MRRLLKIIFLCFLHDCDAILTSTVTYLSFSSSSIVFPSLNINETKLNATFADDTPLSSVSLPQVFPYFGQYVDRIYVSPNGFIQMTPDPECGPYYCSPCSSKYWGSVGGIISDLAPFRNHGSISVQSSNQSVIVTFSQIATLGGSSNSTFSFKISLLFEGTILISYENIPPTLLKSISGKKCNWLTGLVGPKDYNISSILTYEQIEISKTKWGRNISGIHPANQTFVKTGNTFVACPISTGWCVTPSKISSLSLPKSINLTTLSLSCFDPSGQSYIDWAITFSSTPTLYHQCEIFIQSTKGYSDGLSPGVLRCILNSSLATQIGSITTDAIQIHWKPIHSSSYIHLDSIPSIPIHFTASVSSDCAINTPLEMNSNCTACQICSGNISKCSTTECQMIDAIQSTYSSFPSYSYPYDSFYIFPTCWDSESSQEMKCQTTFSYTYDHKGKCCEVDSLDCLGVCNGQSTVGYISSTNHALVCCGDDSPPDCLGVCGGTSYIDACGVCGGSDTGQNCPTYVDIYTNSNGATNKLLTKYNGTHTIDHSSTITIQNKGNTSLLVTFQLKPQKLGADPLVNIPIGEYNLSKGEVKVFPISSNLTRMYSREVWAWEVKTIIIQYSRPSVFGPLPFYIDVLPLATDCNSILGDELCLALPGCIQCLNFKKEIRVLRVEDSEMSSPDDPYSYYYERKLYADIMPDISGSHALDFQSKYHFQKNINSLETTEPSILLVDLNAIAEKDSVIVSAKLTTHMTSPVNLGCVVKTTDASPPSINYIRVHSPRKIISNISSTSLTIEGLEPITNYRIFCLTFNMDDIVTSTQEQMIAMSMNITTLCCRNVFVTLHSNIITSVTSGIDMIELNWKYVKDIELIITLSVLYLPFDTRDISHAMLTNPFQFYELSLVDPPLSHNFLSLPTQSVPGKYQLNFRLSGVDSEKYQIFYIHTNEFTVFSSSQLINETFLLSVPSLSFSGHLLIPSLEVSHYSSADEFIVLSFNSSTNMAPIGRQNVRFNCSLLLEEPLFQFKYSFCFWQTNYLLHILPVDYHPSHKIPVGSEIILFSGKLRSFSFLSSPEICEVTCQTMLFPRSPRHSSQLHSSNSITVPMIEITSPSVIGPYDDFLLDLTHSTGHLQEFWSNYSIVITSSSPNIDNLNELNIFFCSNYSVYNPNYAQSFFFVANIIYIFHISLCNSHLLCTSTIFRLYISPSPIPVITIPSLKYLIINPSDSLQIQSMIYQRNLTNIMDESNFRITWTLRRDGIKENLNSISKRSSIFRLPPGTLFPETNYELYVTVADPSRDINVTAPPLYIFVEMGELVPLIDSHLYQTTLSLGVTKQINGSMSYDENRYGTFAGQAGLHFWWNYFILSSNPPIPTNRCRLIFSALSVDIVEVMLNHSECIDSRFRVTLTLTDPFTNRINSISLLLDVIPAQTTDIRISSPLLIDSSADKIFLEGHITTSLFPSNASWTVIPNIPMLKDQILTSLNFPVLSTDTSYPLVLKQFSLIPFNSYLFTLNFQSSFISFVISALSQPIPGIFSVLPPVGSELLDTFLFSTYFWCDVVDALPIVYEFGFISPSEPYTPLLLTPKSHRTFLSTLLPKGVSPSYHLVCFVNGHNRFGASTQLTVAILVKSSSLNVESYFHWLFHSTTKDQALISIGSSSLHFLNPLCSANCSELNRYPCQRYSCGACLPGYIGEDGNGANTPCYDSEIVSNFPVCSQDRHCPHRSRCNIPIGQCIPPQKLCHNNCSKNGVCVHQSNIGELISYCSILDLNCHVVCHCHSNYSNFDCSLDQDSLLTMRTSRNMLIEVLEKEISRDDDIIGNLHMYVSDLLELTHFKNEIDDYSCFNIATIIDSLFQAIRQTVFLPYEEFIDLSQVLSRCYGILPEEFLDFLFKFQHLLATHMVNFERPIKIIESSFRILVDNEQIQNIPLTSPLTYSLPRTLLEETLRENKISLSFPPNFRNTYNPTSSISFLQTRITTNLSVIANFISNPLQIITREIVRTDVEITFPTPKLRNIFEYNESFTSNCDQTSSIEKYQCQNNYVITHHCGHKFIGTVTTLCPNISSYAYICGVIQRNRTSVTLVEDRCHLIFVNHSNFVCRCNINPHQSLEIIPHQIYEYESAITNVNEFDDQPLSSVLIATFVMFLWFLIMGIGFFCHYVDSPAKSYSVSNVSINPPLPTKQKRGAKSSPTGSLAAYAYMLRYIDQTIPLIFRPKKTIFTYCASAVFRHHRYFRIFTSSSGRNERTRIVQIFHFLSTQSVTLFVLYIILNFQYPNPSHFACQQFQSAEECNNQRSFLDDDVPICSWKLVEETKKIYACHQCSIHLSGEVFFSIVMILALSTGVINIFIDPLMWILHCPIENTLKPIEEQSHSKSRRFKKISFTVLSFFRKLCASLNSENVGKFLHSENLFQLFLRDEDNLILSTRLMNWHDMIIPSLTRLEREIEVQDKLVYVNQLGVQSMIDLKGPLFVRCLKKSDSQLPTVSNQTIHHFMHQLKLQHSLLIGDRRKMFEESWSISPFTGTFTECEYSWMNPFQRNKSIEQHIFYKIDQTLKEAKKMNKRIRYGNDAQRGVQLIHLFVLDLLERESPEARLFRSKIHSDFAYTLTITHLTQILAIVTVISLNVLFISLTVSYGSQRDYSWQRVYLFTYLWCLFFEFFGFEAGECLWVHYLLPKLIQSDVEEAVRVLYRAVDFAFSNLAVDNVLVDVPHYFFISTQVAKEHQELFESCIINSYQTYMGLRIIRNYQNDSSRSVDSGKIADLLLEYLILIWKRLHPRHLLLLSNNLPFSVRNCLFHSISPFLLIILLLLIRKIFYHPIFIFIPLVISILLFCLYAKIRKHRVLARRMRVSVLHDVETVHRRVISSQNSGDEQLALSQKQSDTLSSQDSLLTTTLVMRSPRKFSNDPPIKSDSSHSEDNDKNRSISNIPHPVTHILEQDGSEEDSQLSNEKIDDKYISIARKRSVSSQEIRAQSLTSVVPIGYGLHSIKLGSEAHQIHSENIQPKPDGYEKVPTKIITDRSYSSKSHCGEDPTVQDGRLNPGSILPDPNSSSQIVKNVPSRTNSLVTYELMSKSKKQVNNGTDIPFRSPAEGISTSENDNEQHVIQLYDEKIIPQNKKERPLYRGAFSIHEDDGIFPTENDIDQKEQSPSGGGTGSGRQKSIKRNLSKKMSTMRRLFSRVSTRLSAMYSDSDDFDSDNDSDSRFSFNSDDEDAIDVKDIQHHL